MAIVAVQDWVPDLARVEALLQPDDRARVLRQRMPADRETLTLAYSLHRAFLAQMLGCNPALVPLYRERSGRPRVLGDRIWTSLSHARGWLAFAASESGPVGIDIEPVTRLSALDEVAHAVCHPDEFEHLQALDEAARQEALLSLWVRKEAVLKAAGVGLQIPMDSFVAMGVDRVRMPGVGGLWHIDSVECAVQARAAVSARCAFHVDMQYIDRDLRFSPGRDIASSTDDS